MSSPEKKRFCDIKKCNDSYPFLQLWAKSNPYKSLLSHMIDTGCCAMQFLRAPSSRSMLSFLMQQFQYSEEETLNFVSYLVSLHDIGKAMPQFQCQDEQLFMQMKQKGMESMFRQKHYNRIQHEYYSSFIFSRIWKSRKNPRIIYDSYAAVLFLHHQRENTMQGKKEILPEWIELQEQLEISIREIFAIGDQLPSPQNMDAVCILLSGLMILCDWVASSGTFDLLPEKSNYVSLAMVTAKETLHNYRLIGDLSSTQVDSFQSVWPHISSPRDVQKCCEILNPEAPITIIEAPMGEGKTEAALFFAEKIRAVQNKRGIYVALPTQATSNQMYTRTLSMMETIKAGHTRLLHGTAFLQLNKTKVQVENEEEELEAERWLGSLRMGLLDENGVGTVDQAMAGVLNTRFSVLRLLGLANKVLIIDELHAYDAYMSEIIATLLRWCKVLCIPVILLSATLQDSQRRSYLKCYMEEGYLPQLSSSYPLITQVDKLGHMTQTEATATAETTYILHPVYLGEDSISIAKYALNAVNRGGCYCVLVNTVRRAQEIYQALLKCKDDNTETILFHARFLMGRREEIEKQCVRKFGKGPDTERPHKAILVATQVVEQSLDLDFDGMMTELAPVDLLLQRAGRVHRHRNRQRPAGLEQPIIHVILPDDCATHDLEKRYGNTGYVYAPFLLDNTERIVASNPHIRIPDDIRSVIQQVYEHITQKNMQVWHERCFAQQLEQANADGIVFPDPDKEVFFPSQSHPELLRMEIDDGFEPVMHATTRLGEPTFRISFGSRDLIDAAQKGSLTKEQIIEIYSFSVALSMRRITLSDIEQSSLYRIEKGVLKGCYLSACHDIIHIGTYNIINDPSLGVYWEG